MGKVIRVDFIKRKIRDTKESIKVKPLRFLTKVYRILRR